MKIIKKLWVIFFLCCALAASAQSYKIGDVYTAPDGSRGIVYYLHPDGSGGWVVALNDASTGCTWGASNDVPGLANQNPSYYQQLLNDTAGYANTQTLRNYQNNSTTYAAGKVDFSHGWVLPSPAQLSMLYGQLPFIASAITGAGGTALGYNQYWCSAENSASNAWCVDFGTNYYSGYFTYVAKTTSCRVRAVRSFSNTSVVYDTSLTYQWNTGSTQPYINVSPSQTTTYTVTGTTDYGCSNTAEQTIIVGTGAAQTIYDTICNGAGYEANGFTLTEAQTSTPGTLVRSRTLTTAGCSSTLTLRLRVNEPVVTTFSATACGSYTWNGVTYYESGEYTQTFTAANGCDSVVTLHLTIHHGTHNAVTETVCDSYEWHDSAYTTSGVYTYEYTNADGCPSVDTLHLTVNHGTHNVETETACESYEWHGITCDTSGTYTYEYTNGDGCPSADTLRFTRKHAESAEFAETACESYEWNGTTYTESGDYPQTFTAANGCDSVVTLHLTIIPLPELSHTPNTTIMAGDSANLWASGADVLYWTDGSGNILASGPSLTVSPATSTMYYLTGQQSSAAVGNNLVANGDFEQGNVGFISEYDYNNLAYEGAYYVGYNGQSHYPSFAVWPDHTSSTGLYMIVNGAGTPNSNAWTQSVSVEPNTDYAFSAWICNLSPRAVASGNLQDVAQLQFSVNGTQLGEIFYVPETAGWTSVYEVWNSGNNTTATITILNQNSEWAGNDFGLDDISFIPLADCSVTDSILVTVTYNVMDERTICDSELPYVWNGVTFEHAGTEEVVLQALNGADSVVTLHLTINHGTYHVSDTSLCESIVWHGMTCDTSGTYTYEYTNGDGCPSADTLHFTRKYAETAEFAETACDSYTWNDSVYTASGDYPQTFTAANGCDSVVTLHLTVNHSVTELVEATACESYAWNDSVYTASGDYSRTFTAANGCDSVVTLHLTVNQTSGSLISASVVENSLPCMLNGSSYMEPGTYYQHFTNAAGCDSTVTLQLTVYYNQTVAVDSTVCGDALPVVWNDSVFTASGTKTRVYPAANGADSIVVMTLHVNSSPVAAISGLTALCADSMVTLTADSAYSYLWSTGDTTQAISVTEEGFYTLTVTNEYGCEAVTIHQLSSLGNPILSVTLPDMCAGDSYTFSVGHQGSDNIHLGRGETTLSLTDTVFLPDGVYCEPRGCSYHSPLTFTAYAPGSTIQSADDIHYVRLNMEHSYIGDLYINITCPNGQKADLLKYGGSGSSECNDQIPTSSRGWAEGDNMPGYTFLGNAYDYNVSTCDPSAFGNEPGEGWNYCWSDNTTQGYTYSTGAGGYIYRFVNTPSTGAGSIVDSSDVAAGTQFYHPDDPFSNLIGCPLNGPWYIEVQDGWNSDNGYIFGWELALSSEMLPDISFELAYTTADGPWITVLSDSLFQIDPPANLGNDTTVVYTFTVYDTTGCAYDTTVSVNFYAIRHTELDTVVCEGFVWNDSLHTTSGQYVRHFVSAAGCDSVSALNLTVNSPTDTTIHIVVLENALPYQYNEISYVEAGTYTQYLTNAVGCDSILTVTLTVFPNVTTELDSTVCESDLPVIWNGIAFAAAGTDSVTLQAATGADSAVVMTLHVVALPVITHSADTVIMPGASVNLWATGADIMAWTDADGNPLSSGSNLTVAPTVTTTYYITAFNEGNSVVTNGDFESGNAGFTTAYQYNSNLWPEGNYYVGTNAHNHHGNFPNWYDHTTGSGLYMIVNGATVAGTNLWTQTVPVIPHTSYAFSAWVCTLVGGYSSLARLQFSVNATQLGDIFHSPSSTSVWNRYYEVWYSGENTTATLTILNQNTTGGGNDFGVDDIQFSPLNFCNVTDSVTVYVSGQTDSTVCADALPFIWNGVEFTVAGTQTATITASDGTDSVVVMNLHVNALSYNTFDTAVVENALPLQYNGISYIEAGTYTQHLTNAAGCDSILTVNLTVFPNVTSELDSAVCETAFPFTWNDSVFTAAGTKTTTILAHTGADSTITMTVTMLPTTYGTFDTVIVENALPLQYNGISYVEAGTYTQYLTNAAGCDSVLTVLIDVIENVSVSVDSTVCEAALPLTWNDSVFTAAGTKTTTILAHTGADSVVTMTLHVNPLSYTTIDTAVIENALPLQYNEISYIEAGTYTQNFTNTLGCDSILTIHLTVYQNVTSTVDTTVCAADLPYTWHGHTFTAAGTHAVTLLTSHGADSVVTYHLSVDNVSANIGNVTHITCYGESTGAATASVTGGQTPMTYAWTNASGTNIAMTTSISNRPAGTYTFTVTDHIGCTATATVTLNTLNGELTPGTIAASQEVCDGEDIAPFTGTAASGGNNGGYQWQTSTNGTDWTPAPSTNNAQTYTYPNPASNAFSLRRAWVSQSCGTVYSNVVTVNVWPNSVDTVTASVCQGETYTEYNFDVTADQTVEAGVYTFEQHHATGHCDSMVVLLLTVNPVVAELVEATVCEGEGYNANGFAISPQETIGESVLTRVQNLQTVNGCDSVVTLQLTIIDTALRVEMLTDDFCEHNEASLTALSPMSDYVWSTGETATTIVVTSPGIYSVTASEGGCSATAHIRVEGCHYELVLPNAITPSRGDGLNDCFYIPEGFTPNINLFKVYIYNRWGELVFYSTDKNFRWYGEYRGQTQYQTIYNYVIEYTDMAGRPQRLVGSITVL